MHILRTTLPIVGPDGTGVELAAGEWLMTDENAFTLARRCGAGTVSVRPWSPDNSMSAQARRLSDGIKSILLIRSGAIGDLLLLSPAIIALKEKNKDANIALACLERHWPIISAMEIQTVPYPVSMSALNNYDLIISLEHIIELATDQHATDAFAEALDVTVTDYKPVYKVTEEELLGLCRTPGAIIVPEGGKRQKRVALHLRSSALIRDYPMPLWGQVIGLLLQHGWEVMMLGKSHQIPVLNNMPPQLKNCSELTFRESAAVLATCDVFCGVDSSFFNLCPALGIPAVGLFGPVNWKTRVKEGSGQIALHGEAPCAPCGWTGSRAGIHFPPHGPCTQTRHCVPLSEIDPRRIAAVIEREAKK